MDADRVSHGRGNSSTAGSDTSTPVMRRQGSKISYGSNDSSGSGNSQKVRVGNIDADWVSLGYGNFWITLFVMRLSNLIDQIWAN